MMLEVMGSLRRRVTRMYMLAGASLAVWDGGGGRDAWRWSQVVVTGIQARDNETLCSALIKNYLGDKTGRT